MDLTSLLLDWGGRIGRAQYWLYWLCVAVYLAALLIVASLLFGLGAGSGATVLVLGLAPPAWSGIVVGIKRLHDRDRSAWWLLLLYAAPAALFIAAPYAGGARLPCKFAAAALSLWTLVEFGFLRGTRGANRFGPAR
jgi:uncharacterized membrane protein YhaH (DUF805 family)